MKTSISVSEWKAELERLQRETRVADGLTSREIRKQTGWSRGRISDLLQEAQDQDRLVVCFKRIKAVDGQFLSVPCYRILPSEKPKAAKPARKRPAVARAAKTVQRRSR